MEGAGRLLHELAKHQPALPDEIYEGQRLQFRGYVWRQTFAGPPNYQDLHMDSHDTSWLMLVGASFRFNYSSFESVEDTITVPEARVLHLIFRDQRYAEHKDKLDGDALVTGKVFARHTGHHRGDVLLEVERFERAP